MREKILNILKEIAKVQKVNINLSGDNLDKEFKALGVDSISVLNFIVGIENGLNLKDDQRLTNDELNKVKTVNQLIAVFETRQK